MSPKRALAQVGSPQPVAPMVDSIVLYKGTSSDTYGLGEEIVVGVRFDTSVAVTGTPQVALTIGTQTRQANHTGLLSLMEPAFRYTVVATDSDADGVSIPANALTLNGGTIKHSVDNTLNADLTHNAVAGSTSRKVDGSSTTAPQVVSVTIHNLPASGDTYGVGENIEVRVRLDQLVAVTGTPQVALVIGAQTRQANFNSRVGYSMFFRYTVVAADVDTDGISIVADALALNGGTIKHSVDNTVNAILTHSAVAADSDRKVDGSS